MLPSTPCCTQWDAIASDAEKPSMSVSDPSQGWRRDVQLVGVIFLVNAEWAALRLPASLEAAQQLGETLQSFSERQSGSLLLAHMGCYLYLQTFAIPGTVFFNLLGGALFGVTLGFPLCLAYNTLGSVFMFLVSRRFGRRMALYMIFLRVFPFTPNWFINMASPHLDIPLGQFTLGPLIGLIPYNFLSCKAGLILRELRSRGDIIDTATTVQLIVVAAVGGLVLPRLKKHFATSSTPVVTTAPIKQD
ncbi:Transmembrane protein TMEM64/TMEM41 [Phytophthora cactorum]|nr:Transmembrane protein TMEM64/TMEM41 [Phytophthora cactorum]